jgi:two-component sensor histidine kinase
MSGEPYVGRRVPLTLGGGSNAKTIFVDFVYQPIFEENGEVSGVFVEGAEVTDHVEAQEHLQLINFELKHRVKNTLAVVSAIASQTLQPGGSDARLTAFRHRLAAFGRAHDILTTETWATAQINDVVAAALEPHHDDRVGWHGPKLTLGSRQALSLSLALHELATNATKYGALSLPGGWVDISWDVVPTAEERCLEFEWRESGGPIVVQPIGKGFGSRLIERVVAADFGSEPELSFSPDGIYFRLLAPLDKLQETSPAFF